MSGDVKHRPIKPYADANDWVVVQSDDAGLGKEKRVKGGLIAHYPTIADLPPASEFKGVAQVWNQQIVSDEHAWHGDSYSERVVTNLFSKQFVSEIASSVVQGTGTSTAINKDDATQKITMSIGAGDSGRVFITTPATSFLAGHTYCLSFEIEDLVKGSAADDYLQITGTVPTIDFGTLTLTKTQFTANSRHAIIFQPTTTQTVTWRLGIGIGGNSNGPATLVLKNLMFEDLSESNAMIPSEYVQPLQSHAVLSDYEGTLTNATNGTLTLTKNVKSPLTGNTVAIFGDSYINDNTDYAGQLQALKPKIGVWFQRVTTAGVTVAGTRPGTYLSLFQQKLQALIDAGQRPKYVLIQSSLNTISVGLYANQIAQADVDIAIIDDAANWAIANGIIPILTPIGAWKAGAGAGWITDDKYRSQLYYDQKIYSLAATLGVPVFNLRTPVEDAAVPYLIAAANDSGDGIHPNSTGMGLIAAALKDFIEQLL